MAPDIQRRRAAASERTQAVLEAQRLHKSSRYQVRRKLRHNVRQRLKGSVRDAVLDSLGPACSSCEERTKRNLPVWRKYASSRLDKFGVVRGLTEQDRERAYEGGSEEEEETDAEIPDLTHRPLPDGDTESSGDDSGPGGSAADISGAARAAPAAAVH